MTSQPTSDSRILSIGDPILNSTAILRRSILAYYSHPSLLTPTNLKTRILPSPRSPTSPTIKSFLLSTSTASTQSLHISALLFDDTLAAVPPPPITTPPSTPPPTPTSPLTAALCATIKINSSTASPGNVLREALATITSDIKAILPAAYLLRKQIRSHRAKQRIAPSTASTAADIVVPENYKVLHICSCQLLLNCINICIIYTVSVLLHSQYSSLKSRDVTRWVFQTVGIPDVQVGNTHSLISWWA